MQNYYCFVNCPICFGQGRLFIVEDISNSRPCLQCEECESGFLDPDKIEVGEGFLTFDEDYEYRLADMETITAYGWQKYALNAVPEDQAPDAMK